MLVGSHTLEEPSWGRLREGAESYAKEPTIDILL